MMRDHIDVGTRTELFVDDFMLDTLEDARLQLQHPERREIVFECDAPWEDNVAGFNSVVQRDNSIWLYYRAGIPERGDENVQAIALAESTDGGRSFARPKLGLVEYDGSRDNNLLRIGGPPHVPPAFVDTRPDCPPDERFKGLSSKWRSLYAMCSADGLRWRPMHPEPIEMEGTFDTINTAFWDSLAGCYRSFTRYFENLEEGSTEQDVLGPKPTVVRAIQSSTSQDFVHWTPVVPHQYRDGRRDVQLYTNATVPCPGAEHIYLAFPNRYVQERITVPEHPYPGVNDALFMASRDCIQWTRYLEAWVRPGLDEKNWTDRNNYPTWGIVKSSEREWSVYVSEHYRHPVVRPRLRRLSIRPHGFVSLHAGWTTGQCITKPIVFGGERLYLNCATSAAGSIQVELQDENGAPLEGYAIQDADLIYGDSLNAPVAWGGRTGLAPLGGRPVRLRFVLRDADVYAFRTAKAE
jgi:hypothetical protein